MWKENINGVYYNKELKFRFISEKEQTFSIPTNHICVQFRKTAEYEEEKQKDVSNWTLYEIVEYYKLLNITSYESLLCINSLLSQYTQFCLENNLVKDNQNHFLECNKDLLASCINKFAFNKKIINRQIILNFVNQLPNPRDKFILLALFEFGKSKDFRDIVYANIKNLNGNELQLENRTVNISNELRQIILDCENETIYYSISGTGAKTMPLIDYGYIVKSYPNQNHETSDYQKGRNIYITCLRIFTYLGVEKWMSPNAISESGKLQMILDRAKELNIKPIDYIYSNNIKEVENQYGCNISRSVYIKKYNEYL